MVLADCFMKCFETSAANVASPADASLQARRVLFVELDRTLIYTSCDWEAVAKAVKARPWIAPLLPAWRAAGREALRCRLSAIATPDVELLPYRQEVLSLIRQRRAEGWRVVLVSAAGRKLAERIATDLGLFDDVLSGPEVDGGGAALDRALESYCRQHEILQYTYAGDGNASELVWSHAAEAVLFAPSIAGARRVQQHTAETTVGTLRRSRAWPLARAMRPHHWVKNLLVFTPMVFHHSFSDVRAWALSCLAFALFCLATSAVYLLNDLLDVESDRRHPIKQLRPFAAGTLRIEDGLLAAGGLLASAFGISLAALPIEFTLALLAYVVLNALYSTWLKRKVMIDILVLAGFYSLRIVAGGAATDIVPSEWLLALSMFMFLSLALLKRHGELLRLRNSGQVRTDNRGYRVVDLETLEQMGSASGFLAVLVLALYINSSQVAGHYSRPGYLWLICPLLLYWVGRNWIWARRGAIAEDPLIFAIKDGVSRMVLMLIALLGVLSL